LQADWRSGLDVVGVAGVDLVAASAARERLREARAVAPAMARRAVRREIGDGMGKRKGA